MRIDLSDFANPLTVADAETIKAQADAVEVFAHTAPNVGYEGCFDDNITRERITVEILRVFRQITAISLTLS